MSKAFCAVYSHGSIMNTMCTFIALALLSFVDFLAVYTQKQASHRSSMHKLSFKNKFIIHVFAINNPFGDFAVLMIPSHLNRTECECFLCLNLVTSRYKHTVEKQSTSDVSFASPLVTV